MILTHIWVPILAHIIGEHLGLNPLNLLVRRSVDSSHSVLLAPTSRCPQGKALAIMSLQWMELLGNTSSEDWVLAKEHPTWLEIPTSVHLASSPSYLLEVLFFNAVCWRWIFFCIEWSQCFGPPLDASRLTPLSQSTYFATIACRWSESSPPPEGPQPAMSKKLWIHQTRWKVLFNADEMTIHGCHKSPAQLFFKPTCNDLIKRNFVCT